MKSFVPYEDYPRRVQWDNKNKNGERNYEVEISYFSERVFKTKFKRCPYYIVQRSKYQVELIHIHVYIYIYILYFFVSLFVEINESVFLAFYLLNSQITFGLPRYIEH